MAHAWVEPAFSRSTSSSASSASTSTLSSKSNILRSKPPPPSSSTTTTAAKLKRQFSSCDNDNNNNEDEDEEDDINCDSTTTLRTTTTTTTTSIQNNNNNKFKTYSIGEFEPKHSKELAVSRQKLTELRNWFNSYFEVDAAKPKQQSGQSPFVLLNGPTGSGKTAAVKVIAREMNVECVELPVTSIFNDKDLVVDGFESLSLRHRPQWEDSREEVRPLYAESQLNRFRHFLRDLNYMRRSALTEERVQKLLLIEEVPNVFLLDPQALHEELRLFVARFASNAVPIVFIISETVNGQSVEHKILPRSALTRFNFKVITFKPITSAAMTKALSASVLGQALSEEEISTIVDSSTGDIRHAFNSLIFKYSGSRASAAGATARNKHKRKRSRVERPSPLQIDCSRQEALTVSHAIAKMLYAKRLDEADPEAVAFARTHPALDRSLLRNTLKDSKPEEISERANMTSDSVIEWLHENYADFVFGNDLDTALHSLEVLSEADSLFSDFESKSTVEAIRSSYLTRGIMYALNGDRSAYAEALGEPSNDDASVKPKKAYTFHQLRPPKHYQLQRDISDNCSKVNELKDGLFNQLCQVGSDTSLVLDVLPFVNTITPDTSRDLGLANFVNYLAEFHPKPYHSREFKKPADPDAPVWRDHCPSTIPMEIDSDTIEDDSD